MLFASHASKDVGTSLNSQKGGANRRGDVILPNGRVRGNRAKRHDRKPSFREALCRLSDRRGTSVPWRFDYNSHPCALISFARSHCRSISARCTRSIESKILADLKEEPKLRTVPYLRARRIR